jgi:hypothetical protein
VPDGEGEVGSGGGGLFLGNPVLVRHAHSSRGRIFEQSGNGGGGL